MALHESIEDQPPHKRSRAPALLDSFQQAFAPSSSGSLTDNQSANLLDNCSGGSTFDNNYSPEPNSINSNQVRSPSHSNLQLDVNATRPSSNSNHSASSSVSGLLSPFDRCLTAAAPDSSPKSHHNSFQSDQYCSGGDFDYHKRQQNSPIKINSSQLNSPRLNGSINGPILSSTYVQTPLSEGLLQNTSIRVCSPRGRPLSAVSTQQRTTSQSQILTAPSPHMFNGITSLSPQPMLSQQSLQYIQPLTSSSMMIPCSPVNRLQQTSLLNQQQLSPGKNVQYTQNAFPSQHSPNNILSSDAPRVRLLTAQMVLLLHAHKCTQRDKVTAQTSCSSINGIPLPSCQVQQCSAMKSILNHTLVCQRGDICEVQHCVSSRKLIKHWKACTLPDCPICSPIKIAANQHCTLNPAPLTTSRSCKEWQKCISPEVRSHLVTKIVLCIFPTPDENHQRDKRMQGLVNYARKIEGEMFDSANNQDHYFYLLAEKIYKIRKEIDERRNGNTEPVILKSEKQELVPSSNTSSNTPPINYRMPYNPDTMAGEKGPPNKIAPSAIELGQQQHYQSRYDCFQSKDEDKSPFIVLTDKQLSVASSDNDKEMLMPQDETVFNGNIIKEETSPNATAISKFEIKEEPKEECNIKEEPFDSKFDPHRIKTRDLINSQVLHDIFISDDSIPFRQAVDPILLNIPDYFDIIKCPMDLSTIKTKLDELQYDSPWDFIDDMWQMFANAWTYNKKTSKIYKMCSRLSETFIQLMNSTMISLGYCCGERQVFLPQVLFCYGNQLCSQISRDSQYFCFTNKNPVTNLTNDKYTFCAKCFENIKGDIMLVGDDPNSKLHEIPKSTFEILRNDNQEIEPFVTCKHCKRKCHQICVLHHETIASDGFVCAHCRSEKNIKCRNNRYTAARLSNNKLGQWIENRVNNLFNKNGYTSLVGKVHIRVLASFDKICERKPRIRQYFNGKLTEKFPFRSKAIFAFQEMEDRDVAFFGMHVQEYDAKAPHPNSRRVYISYLDSVYFFQPKQLRTDVYHEILIGYLDWAKRLGFQWGHIWACPPSEGDDYIFYCHPSDQKVPKQKRLIDWYRKMLDKAILDRVVLEYHDIMRDAIENDVKTLVEVPYFDGDFWPNVFEDSIKELQEEENRVKEEGEVVKEVSSVSTSLTAESDEDESMQFSISSKRCSTQKKKKQIAKSKASRKQPNKKLATDCDLTTKVFATMDKHKEVFFVIRLSDAPINAANSDDIVDVDHIIPSDLMDGRDAFLNFSRERHFEFSTLRRAKFSTMGFLFEIHNQGADRFVYSCNRCKAQVEVRYHCVVCDDFDLCTVCYNKLGHDHRMERLAAAIDITSVASAKLGKASTAADKFAVTSPQQSRQQSIERCIESLLHAVNCRNANCSSHPGCQKMKLVIQHIKQCTNKSTNKCQICRQINMLCHHHARLCTDPNCLFPFCTGLKQKMQKQRALNTQLERRRMMTTMQRNMQTAMTSPSAQVSSRDVGFSGVKQPIVRPSLGKPIRIPTIPERSYFMQHRSIQRPMLSGKQMNIRQCSIPQMTNEMSIQQCRMDYGMHSAQQGRIQPMYAMRPCNEDQQRLVCNRPQTYQQSGNQILITNQQDSMWQNRMMQQQQHAMLIRQQQLQQQQLQHQQMQQQQLQQQQMQQQQMQQQQMQQQQVQQQQMQQQQMQQQQMQQQQMQHQMFLERQGGSNQMLSQGVDRVYDEGTATMINQSQNQCYASQQQSRLPQDMLPTTNFNQDPQHDSTNSISQPPDDMS